MFKYFNKKMVYKKDYGHIDNDVSDMIWDLRQIYAIDIVGQTLKDIKMARNVNDFSTWFKLLKRDLATEINHKLDKLEKIMIDTLSNMIPDENNEIPKDMTHYLETV